MRDYLLAAWDYLVDAMGTWVSNRRDTYRWYVCERRGHRWGEWELVSLLLVRSQRECAYCGGTEMAAGMPKEQGTT